MCLQTPDSSARYTFVHNPATASQLSEQSLASVFGHLISTATLKQVNPSQLLEVLSTDAIDVKDGGQVIFRVEPTTGDGLGKLLPSEVDSVAYEQYVRASRAVVDLLKLAPGEQALVVNGRVGFLMIPIYQYLYSFACGAPGRRTLRQRRLCRRGSF